VQSKMESYRSKSKVFARLAAAAKSARDGRRDRKLADMYWALSLGEEPAAPSLSKRSSEPARLLTVCHTDTLFGTDRRR
jgi:hypothetical protein